MPDKLHDAIVAEIERQAHTNGDYFQPPGLEPPAGWEGDDDEPWRHVLSFDGKLDVKALCAVVRAAMADQRVSIVRESTSGTVATSPGFVTIGRRYHAATIFGVGPWTAEHAAVLQDELATFTRTHGLPGGDVTLGGNQLQVTIPAGLMPYEKADFQVWLDAVTDQFETMIEEQMSQPTTVRPGPQNSGTVLASNRFAFQLCVARKGPRQWPCVERCEAEAAGQRCAFADHEDWIEVVTDTSYQQQVDRISGRWRHRRRVMAPQRGGMMATAPDHLQGPWLDGKIPAR